MDIKAYIASGILEQYVLGQVSSQEKAEVEKYAREYPEIRAELEAIEEALEKYARIGKVGAPAGMEEMILKKIEAVESGEDLSKDTTSSRSKDGGTIRWASWALAAATIGAAILAFWMYSQNQNTQNELAKVQAELETLQNNCDKTNEETQFLKNQLKIIRDPDNQPVLMKGTAKAPQAIAMVHWNLQAQKTYLDVLNLPQPPTDKQYQLWAIVDGKPVDMGVFDIILDDNSLQEVSHIANAQAFAVTLEPVGGSEVPTLEEMYVVGNVTQG